MRTASWNTVKATHPKVYRISMFSHQSEFFGEGSWLRACVPPLGLQCWKHWSLKTSKLDLPTALLIKTWNYFSSSVDLAVNKCSLLCKISTQPHSVQKAFLLFRFKYLQRRLSQIVHGFSSPHSNWEFKKSLQHFRIYPPVNSTLHYRINTLWDWKTRQVCILQNGGGEK